MQVDPFPGFIENRQDALKELSQTLLKTFLRGNADRRHRRRCVIAVRIAVNDSRFIGVWFRRRRLTVERVLPATATTKDQERECEEVAKGFEQLASGESSKQSVMDIFEQASLSVASKLASDNTNA